MASEGFWKIPLLLFSLFLIGLSTMISFGITGKNLMYFTETLTTQVKDLLEEDNSSYPNSLRAIIVFNIFLCLYLPFFVITAFKFSPSSFKVMLGLYIIAIWLPRWIVSLVFLEGQGVLNDVNNSEYEQFKDQGRCDLNLLRCGYIRSYVQAQEVETMYGVLFFIFGLLILPLLYGVNGKYQASDARRGEQQGQGVEMKQGAQQIA